MRRALCYGDSNTYGYDPRDPIENRYPPSDRWPEILAERTGWEVVNLGLNGRKIPCGEKELREAARTVQEQLPADWLLIMLGSNDGLSMGEASAEIIAQRMDAFLSALRERIRDLPPILLISPPRVRIPLAHVQELFRTRLPAVLAPLAEKHGAQFASAPAWNPPISPDLVHFAPEGHRVFAERLEACLRSKEIFLSERESPES